MEIGLCLSGGGARCFAHIGILKALEEFNIRPVALSACSTGAIIAALYAAGNTADEILELVRGTDYAELIHADDGVGLSGHERIAELIGPYLPETFEDLDIPLSVPATDLNAGELVVLRSGPLLPAVCASDAFPGLFSPVWIDGRPLIDGGVLNNIPVDLVSAMTDRPVVVVDVSPSAKREVRLGARRNLWDRLVAPLRKGDFPPVLDMLVKAYTITQRQVIAVRYTMHPPALILTPALDHDFNIQNFGRLEEGVELGYREAKLRLETWRASTQAR